MSFAQFALIIGAVINFQVAEASSGYKSHTCHYDVNYNVRSNKSKKQYHQMSIDRIEINEKYERYFNEFIKLGASDNAAALEAFVGKHGTKMEIYNNRIEELIELQNSFNKYVIDKSNEIMKSIAPISFTYRGHMECEGAPCNMKGKFSFFIRFDTEADKPNQLKSVLKRQASEHRLNLEQKYAKEDLKITLKGCTTTALVNPFAKAAQDTGKPFYPEEYPGFEPESSLSAH